MGVTGLPAGRAQGLAAEVPMMTTWRSSKRLPGVAAMTVYRPGVKLGGTFHVQLPLFGAFSVENIRISLMSCLL